MKDFWVETPEPKEKKLNKKKVRNVLIITFVVIIVSTLTALYVTDQGSRNWIDKNILRKEIKQNNVSSIEINPDENTKIYAYNKSIATLSNNILKIYNNSGKEEKNLNVEITNPIFEANNRFLVIAEEKGQKLFFVSGQDIAWQQQLEGSISKVYVNKNGYTSVVVTDTSYKAVVCLYSPEGKELFKTYLSSTRVIDTSISNDNKYLAIAEVDTSGTVRSRKFSCIYI